MMLLPGNNLHLQKIGSSKIDVSMIFMEFLKIGEFVLKFLGLYPLLLGSQQIPVPINTREHLW